MRAAQSEKCITHYLIRVERGLSFAREEHRVRILVIKWDENCWGHVQFRGGDLIQIFASVEIDQPLGFHGEAGHQEELVVIGPDDPGPLLGDDVTSLLQGLWALAGIINPV